MYSKTMQALCTKFCNIKKAPSYTVKKEGAFFMDNENFVKNQMLTLENREKFTIGMVENVESFSEEEVVLKTATGGLLVSGKNLRLEDLSIEDGNVFLTGRINRMDFVDIKEKRSLFASLFR